jgi:hypothetical protein
MVPPPQGRVCRIYSPCGYCRVCLPDEMPDYPSLCEIIAARILTVIVVCVVYNFLAFAYFSPGFATGVMRDPSTVPGFQGYLYAAVLHSLEIASWLIIALAYITFMSIYLPIVFLCALAEYIK